jgi:hypothetical protein
MRLSARATIAPPVLLLLAVVGVPVIGAAEGDRLEVMALSGGGIRATAQILFSAKPAVVQGLLSDYAHWPDLFEVRMRVAELIVQEGVATVDLRIEHALLPGERRLVTESRTLPNGGLVTDLKGGDFKQYHRVWKLQSVGEGNQTQADFELVVEPETLAPDRLIAMITKQELETHFRIVKQKVVERSTP